ncbi:hypothetical protein B0T16DRAFT_499445 [Cercophora newfieldiana]|uniref:ATP-dependent DNA helicase n=1 Tax=Cercophora newfieldiana TaxID=92897 RepID=A0AA39YMY8_9PEZI|nr:hypothetical protein B0T16DRAFT_499445 [Cercophora newfieldiana]
MDPSIAAGASDPGESAAPSGDAHFVNKKDPTKYTQRCDQCRDAQAKGHSRTQQMLAGVKSLAKRDLKDASFSSPEKQPPRKKIPPLSDIFIPPPIAPAPERQPFIPPGPRDPPIPREATGQRSLEQTLPFLERLLGIALSLLSLLRLILRMLFEKQKPVVQLRQRSLEQTLPLLNSLLGTVQFFLHLILQHPSLFGTRLCLPMLRKIRRCLPGFAVSEIPIAPDRQLNKENSNKLNFGTQLPGSKLSPLRLDLSGLGLALAVFCVARLAASAPFFLVAATLRTAKRLRSLAKNRMSFGVIIGIVLGLARLSPPDNDPLDYFICEICNIASRLNLRADTDDGDVCIYCLEADRYDEIGVDDLRIASWIMMEKSVTSAWTVKITSSSSSSSSSPNNPANDRLRHPLRYRYHPAHTFQYNQRLAVVVRPLPFLVFGTIPLFSPALIQTLKMQSACLFAFGAASVGLINQSSASAAQSVTTAMIRNDPKSPSSSRRIISLDFGIQYRYKGHVINFLRDVSKVYRQLPLLLRDVDMIILRPANATNQPHVVRQFARNFKVKQSNIRIWLEFLKENHPGYRDVLIDEANLSQFPEEETNLAAPEQPPMQQAQPYIEQPETRRTPLVINRVQRHRCNDYSRQPIVSFVTKLMNKLIAERDWSSQEVCHLLLNIPRQNGTREVRVVNCRKPVDFCRVKLMMNHPHRDHNALLTVEDTACETYAEAYDLCLQLHAGFHEDDFYGELPQVEEDDEFEHEEYDEGQDEEDWMEIARQLPQQGAETDVNLNYDWSPHVGRYPEQEDPHQLLLQVDGRGGTGKSHVIRLLSARLDALASLDAGRTTSIVARFIDQRLRAAFPHHQDQPFGGRSIMLIGDFFPLPPVSEKPLFNQDDNKRLIVAELSGRGRYHLFNKTIELTQVMRQQGDDQASFRVALEGLRNNNPTNVWGATLEKAVVDISERDFQVGLTYVAVKSLQGIMFDKGFDREALSRPSPPLRQGEEETLSEGHRDRRTTMSIRIALDNPAEFYTNLDVIRGHVVISLSRNEHIGAVIVKLEGESKTALGLPPDGYRVGRFRRWATNSRCRTV